MNEAKEQRVLSEISRGLFTGRERELHAILNHAAGDSPSAAMFVLAKPSMGASELLRQAYDRLFLTQAEIVPFCFEFSPADRTAKRAAVRFLQTFLVQFAAFRKRDERLASVVPDVCELGAIVPPPDNEWVTSLVESCEADSELNDEASFIRQAFSAPLRAAAAGNNVFPLIGGIEYLPGLEGDGAAFDYLKEALKAFSFPYVLSGKRRFLAGAAARGTQRVGSYEIVELDGLGLDATGELCDKLSIHYEVPVTLQTKDLIALQSEGSPLIISALFQSAYAKGEALASFKDVEVAYVRELSGGRIRGYFDSWFEGFSPSSGIQRRLVDLIFGTNEFSQRPSRAEAWNDVLGIGEKRFSALLRSLHAHEFVNCSSNMIMIGTGSTVFNDYLEMRFRLEVERAPRSKVFGDLLASSLKRAPELMAGYYRSNSAIGLKELMALFDCQEIPKSLIDYGLYRELHKGDDESAILSAVRSETGKFRLPQIVYTVNSSSVYDQLSKLTERERSAVALGFEAGDYTTDSETVWIAAEIDSKLEANEELTSFWLDRLEMVALMCDYRRYKLWLIAPEGFGEGSRKLLSDAGAIGSSRKQVELLVRYLGIEEELGEIKPDNAFEMVVPMGEDTELIAAHAVEEIARRHNFGPKAINQIKTALVEACINATEHSHSPDRKIHQRFEFDGDRLIITISNRGLRFRGDKGTEITSAEGRRGWGLRLMKSLMDEVSFERVDDGTRIRLAKSKA
ncbi:MAG: ATP-binding protein [Pyrinomonadaceae bacterium]